MSINRKGFIRNDANELILYKKDRSRDINIYFFYYHTCQKKQIVNVCKPKGLITNLMSPT